MGSRQSRAFTEDLAQAFFKVEAMHLVLDNISKSYSGHMALQNASVEIQKGELVCFLGPSGSGKTTLLNCLCGIAKPTSGRILLEGKDITSMPLNKRNFGIVFQQYALFPNLTVFDNIAYGLHKKERSFIKKRVSEMLAIVGLKGFEERCPTSLSGGQQQRVAIARALAPSPKLLLLDEPLSALDARIRVKLGEDIRWLQKGLNITTIMVTHDQQEAFALADKIVVLNDGHIEQVGTPREIYLHPKSNFVADFFGDTNILSIDGKMFGIRYEDVVLREATENTLSEPNTIPVSIEDVRHYGKFIRVVLLLQDMSTRIMADVASDKINGLNIHNIMAATLLEDRKIYWP